MKSLYTAQKDLCEGWRDSKLYSHVDGEELVIAALSVPAVAILGVTLRPGNRRSAHWNFRLAFVTSSESKERGARKKLQKVKSIIID